MTAPSTPHHENPQQEEARQKQASVRPFRLSASFQPSEEPSSHPAGTTLRPRRLSSSPDPAAPRPQANPRQTGSTPGKSDAFELAFSARKGEESPSASSSSKALGGIRPIHLVVHHRPKLPPSEAAERASKLLRPSARSASAAFQGSSTSGLRAPKLAVRAPKADQARLDRYEKRRQRNRGVQAPPKITFSPHRVLVPEGQRSRRHQTQHNQGLDADFLIAEPNSVPSFLQQASLTPVTPTIPQIPEATPHPDPEQAQSSESKNSRPPSSIVLGHNRRATRLQLTQKSGEQAGKLEGRGLRDGLRQLPTHYHFEPVTFEQLFAKFSAERRKEDLASSRPLAAKAEIERQRRLAADRARLIQLAQAKEGSKTPIKADHVFASSPSNSETAQTQLHAEPLLRQNDEAAQSSTSSVSDEGLTWAAFLPPMPSNEALDASSEGTLTQEGQQAAESAKAEPSATPSPDQEQELPVQLSAQDPMATAPPKNSSEAEQNKFSEGTSQVAIETDAISADSKPAAVSPTTSDLTDDNGKTSAEQLPTSSVSSPEPPIPIPEQTNILWDRLAPERFYADRQEPWSDVKASQQQAKPSKLPTWLQQNLASSALCLSACLLAIFQLLWTELLAASTSSLALVWQWSLKACIFSLLLGLPAFILFRLSRQSASSIAFQRLEGRTPLWSTALLGLCLGGLASIGTSFVQHFFGNQGIHIAHFWQSQLPKAQHGTELAGLTVGVVLLPVLAEEFLLRSLLFQEIEQRGSNALWPILHTALIGALLGSNGLAFGAFVSAMIYGFLRYWTRSVYPALLCHLAFNLSAYLLAAPLQKFWQPFLLHILGEQASESLASVLLAGLLLLFCIPCILHVFRHGRPSKLAYSKGEELQAQASQDTDDDESLVPLAKAIWPSPIYFVAFLLLIANVILYLFLNA